MWLEGSKSDLDSVNFVGYILHPTFRNPVRTIKTRHNGFKLNAGGWGVFPVFARACKADGTIVRLKHQLKLTYPDGEPNSE